MPAPLCYCSHALAALLHAQWCWPRRQAACSNGTTRHYCTYQADLGLFSRDDKSRCELKTYQAIWVCSGRVCSEIARSASQISNISAVERAGRVGRIPEISAARLMKQIVSWGRSVKVVLPDGCWALIFPAVQTEGDVMMYVKVKRDCSSVTLFEPSSPPSINHPLQTASSLDSCQRYQQQVR